MKTKAKESALQKQILEYLKIKKVFAWKNHSTGIYDPARRIFRTNTSVKGVSDILGILPNGRFLAIEVKIKPNKLSDNQHNFLVDINNNKGLALVVCCIEDVFKFIE